MSLQVSLHASSPKARINVPVPVPTPHERGAGGHQARYMYQSKVRGTFPMVGKGTVIVVDRSG